ncbi:MAG: hypothetical protein FWF81_05600, partial [Defluviitaleaceae bacterium]|nr:hypothetical protein [Defluviitaleaceae bacterium]
PTIFFICVFLFLTSCAALPIEDELPLPLFEPPAPVIWETAIVHRGDVIWDTVILPRFTAEMQEIVRFTHGGYEVEWIYIIAGDEVYAGQIIATLMNPELDEAIEASRRTQLRLNTELAHLNQRHENSLMNAEIQGIPLDDFHYLNGKEQLAQQIYAAELNYAYLLEQRESMLVRAPFDGVATTVTPFWQGRISELDGFVASISSVEHSFFRVQHFAPEGINSGDRFDMTVTAMGITFEVEAVIPDVADHAHAMGERLWFSVVEGDDILFEEGTIGRIVHTLEEATNVVVVPPRALGRLGERDFVLVLEDGVSRKRFVETGIRGNQYVEIISGLDVGEVVVL